MSDHRQMKRLFKNKGWELFDDGSFIFNHDWKKLGLSINQMWEWLDQMVRSFPQFFEENQQGLRLCETCLLGIGKEEIYSDFYHCHLCRKDYPIENK